MSEQNNIPKGYIAPSAEHPEISLKNNENLSWNASFAVPKDFAVFSSKQQQEISDIIEIFKSVYKDEIAQKNQTQKFLDDVSEIVKNPDLDEGMRSLMLDELVDASNTVLKNHALIKTEYEREQQGIEAEKQGIKTDLHDVEFKDVWNTNTSDVAVEHTNKAVEALSLAKQRIQELTGKSPESIIGEQKYQSELTKNEEAQRKIWESKNGSLAKLTPDQQQSVQKEIRAKAETRVLETFRTEIVNACPEGSREELNKVLSTLLGTSGKQASIIDEARRDPTVKLTDYQLAKTISGDRRDIYQDGHVTRAVADEKGVFPSFVPGKGLYMNTDHLNIRIQLAPEDELRVNDLQSAEIKDKIQLDSLKTADTKENLMRQSTARNAWSKTMIEWNKASEWVHKILKQKWIDLSQPEGLKNVLNQGTISALRTDPELQTAIKKGIDDGSEFAPAEFFNGLDSLAVFLKQNNEDAQLKRTTTINQLQAKLDSKNPDSYSNLTKSIYEQAYETSRKNLLILTEEFGLDGAGQQFVDNFLAILNEHRAGAAKLNLSKELTSDKKKDIALALNALIKKNPPLFSVQNGEVDTQISPIERKQAILNGLREQKFLLPPDDRVSETGIRSALGSK